MLGTMGRPKEHGAQTRAALLAAMRAAREAELAAIARAAADKATSERLAVVYKIDT